MAQIHVDGVATWWVRMSASGSGIHWMGVKHDQFSHFSELGPRSPGRTLYVGLMCHVRDGFGRKPAQIHVDGVALWWVRMNASGSRIHWVGVKHDQFSHFSKLGPRSPGCTLYVGLICHVRDD